MLCFCSLDFYMETQWTVSNEHRLFLLPAKSAHPQMNSSVCMKKNCSLTPSLKQNMHLHKELQEKNTKTEQVWPEQLLRIGVLLILDICNQGMQNSPNFFCPTFCVKEKFKQAWLGDSETFPVTWGLDLWPEDLLSFFTEVGSIKSKPKLTLELQCTQQNWFFSEPGHCAGCKAAGPCCPLALGGTVRDLSSL